MARLIDADALRLMMVEECAGHSIEYALGWKACIEYIKLAPTIDAIPVEWLREWQDEVGTINEWWPIIERIITVWHDEQEAR